MKGIFRHKIWASILAAVLFCVFVGGGAAVAILVTNVGTREGDITPKEPISFNDSSDFAVSAFPDSSVFVELSVHNASMSPITLALGRPYTPAPGATIYLVNDLATVDPGDTILLLEYRVEAEAALGDHVLLIEAWRGDVPMCARNGVITVVAPSVTLISTAPFSITDAYAGDIVTQDFIVHSDYAIPVPLAISAVATPRDGPVGASPEHIALLTTSAIANPHGDTVIPVQFKISESAFPGAVYDVDVTISM